MFSMVTGNLNSASVSQQRFTCKNGGRPTEHDNKEAEQMVRKEIWKPEEIARSSLLQHSKIRLDCNERA